MPKTAPEWRLKVRDFGTVIRADIETAPLLLLVGKNNTGKSYIASLLWALLNSQSTLFRYRSPSLALHEKLEFPSWFDSFVRSGEGEAVEEDVKSTDFARWVNRLIEERQSSLLESLIAWRGAKAKSIEIDFPNKDCIAIRREPLERDEDNVAATYRFESGTADAGQYVFSVADDEGSDFMADIVMKNIASHIMNPGKRGFGAAEPVYIPAARTGFMLAISQIISGLFDQLQPSDDGVGQSPLPLPMVRFLRLITSPTREQSANASPVADFLEESIVGGSIQRSDKPVPEFEYRPRRTRSSIPLRAASSMITELAPFLFLLRNNDLSGGVVFEEPEAHLHISAQRYMARAIARLVNMGIPIVVTTHSDTFLQQLNLLITLHTSASEDSSLLEKYGYGSVDLIDPKSARAYEFIPTAKGTTVRQATLTEFGFAVPSINEVLEELAEESIAIQA